MIKIGIIGTDRIGELHLNKLLSSDYFKVIGCYDTDKARLERIKDYYDIASFDNVDELMQKCDALDILVPVNSRFYYAEKAIRFGKHVFIDKPISTNLDEAKRLVELIKEAGIKFQVSFLERFNPAFLAFQQQQLQPKFIESHHLSNFDARHSTASIVFEEMIHDIDIVLSIVKANIKTINASGVSVISDYIDVANARIEFDNGCVANLTTSRTSLQKMRKMLFFQKDNHITLDFLHRETEVINLSETAKHNSIPFQTQENIKYLNSETVVLEEYDSLKEELNNFAESLIFNTEPKVTALDSLKSLEVAHEIIQKINKMNGNTMFPTNEQLIEVA